MDAYIGEIRLFAGSFAPVGWAYCDGSALQIAKYQALFGLIKTIYGGDGQTTFNLPDLRGRVPVHSNPNASLPIGQAGGSETVTLTAQQTAAHNHGFVMNGNTGTAGTPPGNLLAQPNELALFYEGDPDTGMGGSSIAASPGGGTPHANIQPYQALNYIICLQSFNYPSPG